MNNSEPTITLREQLLSAYQQEYPFMARTQPPLSESFQRGQRDGQLLAEDFPGRTESEMHREAELQLRLLTAMGVRIQAPQEYIKGLFAGYQAF